jgi:quinol monooxygenase YgiN
MNNQENLTVVATIVAKFGSEQVVEKALLRLISPTQMEPGFMQYDLHRSTTDARTFVFVEKWQSRELHAQHMQSPHLSAYQSEVAGHVESWDVKLLVRIG